MAVIPTTPSVITVTASEDNLCPNSTRTPLTTTISIIQKIYGTGENIFEAVSAPIMKNELARVM
jgi:hypothetical protein